MNSRVTLIIVAISLFGLIIRLIALDARPVHTDEAVHALVLGKMLKSGVYHYDPTNSHGPLFYYLNYPILLLLGDRSLADMQAWHLRFLSALIGAATVASLLYWQKILAARILIFAALFLALSAPLVYFQRYAIHESLFVLLSLIFLRLVAGLWTSRANLEIIWVALGTLTGLLLATKESAPLVGLAAALAFFFASRKSGQPVKLEAKHLIYFFVPFFLIVLASYSSFGTNLQALSNLSTAALRYTHRVEGEGHEKPMWTYLSWLLAPSHFSAPWSGLFILMLSTLSVWIKPPLPIRFLAFYSLFSLLFYSVIPYKTPWLEINFLAPATLPAGYTVSVFWIYFFRTKKWGRQAFALLSCCILLTLLGAETRALCFVNPVDARNILAYSPTVPDINKLDQALATCSSAQTIAVISSDYWPLPWYLRRFKSVGYWPSLPEHIDAPIVITSPELSSGVLSKMPSGSTIQYFGLRPDVLAVLIFAPSPATP